MPIAVFICSILFGRKSMLVFYLAVDMCLMLYFLLILFYFCCWRYERKSGNLRRPGFAPVSVHVRFVVGKVVLGQVFSPSTSYFPVSFITPVLHYLEKGGKN